MRKVLAALVAALMVFAMAVPAAMAASTDDEGVTVEITPGETDQDGQTPAPDTADDETDATDDEATKDEDETEKILTPESPFYFLKRFVESVKLFLTFDEEKKVQLLSELAEERAKELETLQAKYADGELTEAQFELLEEALDDLVLSTERLVNSLVPDEEEVTDPDKNTGADEDQVTDEDDDEAADEDDDEATDEDDDGAADEDNEEYADKYLRRIAHLQRIAECAPEAAQNGLGRAIQNALRQRERAIAKGKIADDPVDETEDESANEVENDSEDEEDNSEPVTETEGIEIVTTDTTNADFEGDDKSGDYKEKSNQGKSNNGRKPSNTSPGKGKGKKGN